MPRAELVLPCEVIVVRVSANPKNPVFNFDTQCPVMNAYPGGPQAVELLEVEGWVVRVSLQESEGSIS